MYSFLKSGYGFTMLPLILFMFVIVGLLSAGYMMLGPKVQLGKTVKTKAGLEKAVDAIISWSVANGRIPNATDIQTILPQTVDSYGAKLGYLFDANLADKTKGGVCGRIQTDAKDAANVYYAFVLISRGNDYTINSTPTPTALLATDPILTFQLPAIPSPYNGLSTSDIYRVVTLEELKNRAGCYGTTEGRLKILNNELPKGCTGVSYSATIFAGGGVPPYPTCTITGLPAGLSTTGTHITGIPSTTGTFPVYVQIADSHLPTANTAQKNMALTVNSCGASLPTPAAAWNFNEGIGNTIGSGSTLGTIAGTANWVVRGGGSSLFLNGTNNYIYFNDINYFNIGTSDVALSAWVNFSGMPKQSWCDPVSKVDMAIGAIAGKGFLYPAIGYGMYVTQTRQCTSCTSGCGAWSNYKVAFQLRNPANTDIHYVTSDDAIASGSWAHIVAVLDRNASPATDQIKMYINGIKQTNATNDNQFSVQTLLNFDNTFKFTIGARHDGGSGYGFPYWGYIDDVYFYKAALTDAQAKNLYIATAIPYRVWNNSGANRWYTYNDGTTTSACSSALVANNSEFSQQLRPFGTLRVYSNSTCTTLTNTLFFQTITGDTNNDGCINLSLSDRTCP